MSIMLLDGVDIATIFRRTLTVLHGNLIACLKSEDATKTAKLYVSGFSTAFVAAFKMLGEIFDNGALFQRLEEFKTSEACVNILPRKFVGLPDHLLNFSVDLNADILPRDVYETSLESWFFDVQTDAMPLIHELLGYCPSLASVRAVRNRVCNIQSSDKEVRTPLTDVHQLRVYRDVVKPCVVERCRVIVGNVFATASKDVLNALTKLLSDVRSNPRVLAEEGAGVVHSMWTDDPSDLPDKVGWKVDPQLAKSDRYDAYTNKTKKICNLLESKLEKFWQDLQQDETDDELWTEILCWVEEETVKTITSIVEQFEPLATVEDKDVVTLADEEVQDGDSIPLTASDVCLCVVARLSHAMANACPVLRLTCLAQAMGEKHLVRRVSMGLPLDQQHEKSWQKVSARLDFFFRFCNDASFGGEKKFHKNICLKEVSLNSYAHHSSIVE